ncbi:uncharacterized protein LOC127244787 isoform X2 [Andrographis paniculata]|uniref:uncharacterized protein LOC127244787 isoform X2 n=1 Tax=Andrographis paniculata TaxID=175694 RepID=UPI0021E8B420|nr:uncharacterized protein LOC127244787 isoform X2 [Andrographis paniculata]
MDSDMEPVAVTSQKHDPAWKHCQMFKNGDKVQLKCIYCGKIFKGGGIHRIKEHLAGQKGNAATCLRVQHDVRLQMIESLNGVAVKKRKKQKLSEEVTGFDNPGPSGVEVANNSCSLTADIALLPVPEMIENDADVYVNREEGESGKPIGRKKKGRIRKAPDVINSNALVLASFPPPATPKKNSNTVNMAVGRFFCDVGLPMEATKSPYFQPMIDAIASQGAGVVGPSYHDLRGWVLKNLVHEARYDTDQCTGSWGKTGCSILVDEWNSGRGKTFVNFTVYSPEGTIFLRSADISQAIDSADTLYELLKETVEEVGLRNVVQVVTSNEERYVIAGELPTVKMTLDQAKSISRYIYSNSNVLNMMRRYTFGLDLVDLGDTRATTDFLTLKRMVSIKHNLQSMVTSEEWMESSFSKKPEGFAVLDSISSPSFWTSCTLLAHISDPLLRLLRIVTSEKRPSMGYVYAGLYRAKEAIKKELVRKEEYSVYWNIIDRRWELQRHPLLAAGFYLNPKFFFSLEGDAHLHIRSLVYDCIEKLVPDAKIQDKIMKETASYHGSTGDFGRKMAIRARDTLLPTEWWLAYAGSCPNLARLATRILSQTCCLVRSKPSKIPLDLMHERKNSLEHQRLSDLVFVQYSMMMKQMGLSNKHQETSDPISYEHMDIAEDWVLEKELGSEGSGEWMTVDPPLGNVTLLGEQADDYDALGSGFDDFEIFEVVKETEDENGDENVGQN